MSIAFLVTALVVVLTPGTGALLTVSAGLARGRRAALVTAAGCTLGVVPHLVAAVTGAAALLRVGGLVFEAVKVLGVVYLLWMAVTTWRDRSPLVAGDGDAAPTAPSAWRTVGSAVSANLLNPKLTVFFFAFLPQFVRPGSAHQLSAMLLLSLVFMAMTLVVFSGYGLFAVAVRRHVVDRPRVVRRLRQAFAVSFVGLGARLAVERR